MKSGIVINFRYNDPSFNPKTIYGSIDESEEAKMKNLGIRMLYQLGKTSSTCISFPMLSY